MINNLENCNRNEACDDEAAFISNPDTLREKRLQLVQAIFPQDKKQKMLQGADKDRSGRSVSYFRLLGKRGWGALMDNSTVTYENNLQLEQTLKDNLSSIVFVLRQIIGENMDEAYRTQTNTSLDIFLMNPQLKDLIDLLQKKLSRIDLYKFHTRAGPGWCSVSGLISLSIGAPMMMPGEKEIAVELVIPHNEIHIPPPAMGSLREWEKEAVILLLKREWICDVYIDEEDISQRFLADSRRSISAINERMSPNEYLQANPTDVLQEWKREEGLAAIVPSEKLSETDIANPILLQPLVPSS